MRLIDADHLEWLIQTSSFMRKAMGFENGELDFFLQTIKDEPTVSVFENGEEVKPEMKEVDLGLFGKSAHPYCKCGFPLRFRHGDETPIDKYCSNCGSKIDWSGFNEER